MAANYWMSSHANEHILTRHGLRYSPGRDIDLRYATDKEVAAVMVWAGGAITRIGKRLNCRQYVIATAIVFFRRFYVNNALAETDSCLVAAACVYVAAKSEEAPIHVKTVVEGARAIFGEFPSLGIFPSDASQVAEMEFYLISDLSYHLVVWHPYRDLLVFTGREDSALPKDGEANVDEWAPKVGDRRWEEWKADIRRKEEMMYLDDEGFKLAWAIINDTYRSDICLLYPPYLIALGALYIALVMNPPPILRATKPLPQRSLAIPSSVSFTFSSPLPSTGPPRRGRNLDDPETLDPYPSTTMHSPEGKPEDRQCPVEFFARLSTPMPLILEVVQEIVSLYELWNSLDNDPVISPHPASTSSRSQGQSRFFPLGSSAAGSAGTDKAASTADERAVQVLVRMRRDRERDVAHPS